MPRAESQSAMARIGSTSSLPSGADCSAPPKLSHGLTQSISMPDLMRMGLHGAAWLHKRPAAPNAHLKRRELRKLNRTWTLAEVQQHHYVDDAWIAVDGKVYDITEHLVNHEGWGTAGVTTPLSILAHAGTECSVEFHSIHRAYPVAYKQLRAYYIGDVADELQPSGAEQCTQI
eukprot:CAMPEP_0202861292 /NCGR_PEP_ID=MMETSP1391-20130828/2744_1 /ASSEMBLY_ACC=CAM_ASM_000867 /TAXON_ID=1034604 /ORGANISM="Chlamydomonas leiostraca, Strain SAG 11-49" /LENGTH=173 /DNA_ID=CAMNT_0049540659 /DNA_START=1641 /DNA_END=2162 /DNA_ORIENTATION=+